MIGFLLAWLRLAEAESKIRQFQEPGTAGIANLPVVPCAIAVFAP
jgi:hypothetical protein